MIGADLAEMSSLANRFVSAGDEFSFRSSDIATELTTAGEKFRNSVDSLKREADTLSTEIRQSVAMLSEQAARVTWTGTHRAKHDQFVSELSSNIEALKAGIDDFSTQAQAIVVGSLTSTLTEMTTRVGSYGNTARATTAHFEAAVISQRNAFDAVMNQ